MPSQYIQSPTQKRSWIAVIALALSIFTVVSTEMLPIGLLSPIARSYQASEGYISFTVTAPAFIAAFTAPLILLFFSTFNRKYLLLLLMSLLLLSNLLSAFAPNISMLFIARILLGISMGGIWTIAGGLAIKLVSSEKVALATSIIFSGVAAASVFGIPLGVYLGDLLNWQFAFIIMAIMTLCLIGLLIWSLPSLPQTIPFQAIQFQQLFKNRMVNIGLLLTFLLVAGHFMSYTFIRPLLTQEAQFSEKSLSSLLFLYGLFGILGNFILGNLIKYQLKGVIALISIMLMGSILLLLIFTHQQLLTILALLLWGFAYGAVSVSLMNWMFMAAPKLIESATAIYIGSFNLSIAIGAFLGGQIYDNYSISVSLIGTMIMVLLAFCLVLISPNDRNNRD